MIYLPRSILERYLLPQDNCRCKLAVNAAARSLVYKASHPGEQNKMDRRVFIAGCVGLSLTVKAAEALAQSGPLTRIVFPFAAGGRRGHAVPDPGPAPQSASRSHGHRRKPHRRGVG